MHSLYSITLIIRLLLLPPLPRLPRPLLRILLRLAIHLLLDLAPLRGTPITQLRLERLELVALGVHADEALQELDLVGPDLLVLDGFPVGALLVDGRLEDHGHALEGRVVHDAVEGAQAEEARADVGVEVAVGGEGGFAVVYCGGYV